MTFNYARWQTIGKQDVNVRRYNKQVMKRKLRLASFVSAPILRKTFHNNPVMK